jgi:hypothetical protein
MTTSEQLMTRAELTLQQTDHRSRVGYLKPARGIGTSHSRSFPPVEVEIAKTMGRLVGAGLKPADTADGVRGKAAIGPGGARTGRRRHTGRT